MTDSNSAFDELFSGKRYDIENALNLYADSFVLLPARLIDEAISASVPGDTASQCHIYLIGHVPKISIEEYAVKEGLLRLKVQVGREQVEGEIPIPNDLELIDAQSLRFANSAGNEVVFSAEMLYMFVQQSVGKPTFDVLYVGQAFGTDGSRAALDRLKQHGTLQKIAIQGPPEGHELMLLLLGVVQANRMVTLINPLAEDKSEGAERIGLGVDKLRHTTEQERVAVYEASLIRYFKPRFNKQLKESFPSTSLKVLQDCYQKDLSAVISEIAIDELPFLLGSDARPARDVHCAIFHLQDEPARRVFFGLEQ